MSEYDENNLSSGQSSSDPETPNSANRNFPNSTNNSIIGKVKTRVTSILPNSISKWFSPSTKNQHEATLNGRLNLNDISSRRRRRIEIDEDDDYDNDDVIHNTTDFVSNRCLNDETIVPNHIYQPQTNIIKNREVNIDDQDNDNGEVGEVYADLDDDGKERNLNVATSSTSNQFSLHSDFDKCNTRRNQPPAKRSRLDTYSSGVRDISMLTRQPLSTSTPATSGQYRNSNIMIAPRSSYKSFTRLNLHGNQNQKEPPYNFTSNQDSIFNKNAKLASLLLNDTSQPGRQPESLNKNHLDEECVPSTSLAVASTISVELGRSYETTSYRIPKHDLPSSTSATLLSRTSTKLSDIAKGADHHKFEDDTDHLKHHNGFSELSSNINSKRKLSQTIENIHTMEKDSNILDTASESSESYSTRRGGLYNTSASNNHRYIHQSLSHSNGLNFFTHLEGRKSLFAGAGAGAGAKTVSGENTLNNSTLSLTSLNRRQFNASIYGSTSALSDSRLLNTCSPFYKGKTTYGGAAAYNRFNSCTGASSVRITPTRIRPTVRLSNISSASTSSLTNTGHLSGNSNISSTAKRILDLINEFNTPLNEAKKMANSIRMNSPQFRNRLNENDLNISRATRLSQVRTPYSKPTTTKSSGRLPGPLPPVKELQVPTMSQLLQMKKIHDTTEKSRQIATESMRHAPSVSIQKTNYTKTTANVSKEIISDVISSSSSPSILQQSYEIPLHTQDKQIRQQHTNKIKTKLNFSVRTSSSRDFVDPPKPVNLPNIAFPLMKSVPTFDIKLPISNESMLVSTSNNNKKSIITKLTDTTEKIKESKDEADKIAEKKVTSESSSEIINVEDNMINNIHFKFSSPLKIISDTTISIPTLTTDTNCYIFRPPASVESYNIKLSKTGQLPESLLPPLKDFSCLQQSKEALEEWECHMCLISNTSEKKKCSACETTRINTINYNKAMEQSTHASALLIPNFGQQFNKYSDEWDCETCLVRNKNNTKQCLACNTLRKETVMPIKASEFSFVSSTAVASLSPTFKTQTITWICNSCYIVNKNEHDECIACRTTKPEDFSAKNLINTNPITPLPSTSFIAFDNKNKNVISVSTDKSFKVLAAEQKFAKWECVTCMTRNDNKSQVCICCEQPKPGLNDIDDAKDKFSFGATSAAKFTFGFAQLVKSTTNNTEKINTESNIGALSTSVNPISTSELVCNEITTECKVVSSRSICGKIGYSNIDKQFPFNNIDSTEDKVKMKQSCRSSTFISPTNTVTTNSITNFNFNSPTTKNELFTIKPQSVGFVFPAHSDKSLNIISTSSNTPCENISTTTIPIVRFSLPNSSTTQTVSNCGGQSNVIRTTMTSESISVPSYTFGSSTTVPTISTNVPSGCFTFKNMTSSSDVRVCSEIGPKVSTISSSSFSGFNFNATCFKTTSSIMCNVTTIMTTSIPSVKPIFNFGSPLNTTPAISSSNNNNTFNFSSPSYTMTGKSLFGATTISNNSISNAISRASSSLTTDSSSTTCTTYMTAVKSINTPTFFGSFTSSQVANISSTNNNPMLSAFNKDSKVNIFGSCFSGLQQNESKPTNTSVFSSFPITDQSTPTINAVSSSNTYVVTSSTIPPWTKNNFGSTLTTLAFTNAGTYDKPSTLFSFGSSNSYTATGTSSIFGSVTSQNAVICTANSGSNNNNVSTNNSMSTNLFGCNSSMTYDSQNIFGTISGNKSQKSSAPSAFGTMAFGTTAVSSSLTTTPTFGNSTNATNTQYIFAGVADKMATDVKSAKAPFTFGAAQNAQGGFNFANSAPGSVTPKPAFNFGATSASPVQNTFNFTGVNEQTTISTTRPFQFNVTPTVPVFNFTGSAIETAPNTPFQFNANPGVASSNIFAPSPTTGGQSTQQGRRRVRVPVRRLTPR